MNDMLVVKLIFYSSNVSVHSAILVTIKITDVP